MNEPNSFDPYQVFEVEHLPCLLFHVKVLSGRNVTKGWAADLLDTPDPYVILKIRSAPDGKKRTRTIDNEINPVWNEDFTFLLDYREKHQLLIFLMEDNYVCDQLIGEVTFDIGTLYTNSRETRTFIFNGVSEVDLEMLIEFDTKPTLRYSLCLPDEEKTFIENRKYRVFEGLNTLLGDKGPQSVHEVPTIAAIGSGGGFRAMVGMSGVCKALADCGVLDCLTYMGGLSGSSWYISTLYSHPEWPHMSPGDMQEELKNNIDSSLLWLLKPQSVYRYMDRIVQKRQQGQPVSFTDFFGHMVGETLLCNRLDAKLTDQQAKINDGRIPMPLYTCVHVKKDVSARSFQEWVEFTPYEIGLPKYGTYLKSEIFGSKFFMGKLCKSFEEPPLHFLQGIWGSAFCILFKRLLENNRRLDPVEMIRQEIAKELEHEQGEESSDSSNDEEEEEEEHPQQQRSCKVDKAENGSIKSSAPSKVLEPPLSEEESNKTPSLKRMGGRRWKKSERISPQKRMTKKKHQGFWRSMLEGIFENNNFELLNSRAGRAGIIHNFMRGLSLQNTYPLSPFTPQPNRNSSPDEFDGLFEMYPTNIKHLYMVDAGLTFNSPYPLVLRPQRNVDIILSFDFSARPSDSTPPFKELLLAEKWAKLNGIAFPPINPTVFDREGMKELYVFKHPDDPHCPVVMHFVIVNIEFRKFKQPGVPRETEEEKSFADFDLFDDISTPYSTFNFKYSHKAFDRLSKLCEFNTLLNLDEIKRCFAERIEKKQEYPPKLPIAYKDVKLLRIKSQDNRKKLRRYLRRVQSMQPTSPGSRRVVTQERVCQSANFSEVITEIQTPAAPAQVRTRLLSSISVSALRTSRKISTTSIYHECLEDDIEERTEDSDYGDDVYYSPTEISQGVDENGSLPFS